MKTRTPKPNKNKAEPPTVVYLPEDMVDAAKAVIEESEIPPGPTSSIATFANENTIDGVIVSYDSEEEASADLLQAATDPAAALRDTHNDIPVQTEEELAAIAIQEALGTDLPVNDHSALEAVLADNHSPEANFVEASYAVVTKAQAALEQFGANIKTTATYVGLRVIRAKNDSWDFIKMLGNKAYAFYDKYKKRFEEAAIARKAKEYAEIANYLADTVAERFSALEHTVQVELRRNANRIVALEKVLHSDFKKANNVSNGLISKVAKATTPTVDPKQLNEFTKALLTGRKTQAVSLYRALTGTDLATAKAALELAVAA